MKALSGLRLVTAWAFGLCALAAEASEWVNAAQSAHQSVLLDVSSVKRAGSLRTAWIKSIEDAPRPMSAIDPRKYWATKEMRAVDCDNGASGSKVIVFYAESHAETVVDSVSWPIERVDLREHSPDSVGEALVRIICAVPLN